MGNTCLSSPAPAFSPLRWEASVVFWRRCGALLIDLALWGTLQLAYFLVLALSIFQAVSLDFQVILHVTIVYMILALTVPLLLGLAYFTILHAWGGQTVGKMIMGLQVRTMDGTPLGLGASFLRTVGYLVSALPLGAGFLWAVLDRDHRAWHDHLAGSQVIAG
jgi:uncharacterized RDD family membrane protein YckC